MRVSSSCNLWSLFNKRAFRVHYAGAIRNSFSKPTQEKLTTAHTYEIIHPARKKLCSEIMIISRTVSKLRLARINEENRKIEKSKRHELITQSDIIRVRGLKTEASQTISPQKTWISTDRLLVRRQRPCPLEHGENRHHQWKERRRSRRRDGSTFCLTLTRHY